MLMATAAADAKANDALCRTAHTRTAPETITSVATTAKCDDAIADTNPRMFVMSWGRIP